MTLPENQPQNQDAAAGSAAPVFGGQWREVLKAAADGSAYSLLNGARLLPLVQGKRPIIHDWSNTHLGPADILSGYRQATGFGVVTGPQWPWPDGAAEGTEIERPEGTTSLICFDFDGPSAREWAKTQNLPWPTTWMISRLGADEGGSAMVDGRAKMVFTTTPEQSAALGSWFICKEPTGDGEALEIFHHRGRQLAALGKYGKPGAAVQPPGWYCWPEGWTPNTITQLPQEWFDLAMAVHGRWKAGRLERGNRARKAFSNGADWETLDRCPICGRDENLICSVHKTSQALRCFADGETFHYRKKHGELTPGPKAIITGLDGIQYAFLSERADGPQGMLMANFVIDKPLPERQLAAAVIQPPEPWTPEPPAAEQTIDIPAGNQEPELAGGITADSVRTALDGLKSDLADGRIATTTPEGVSDLDEKVRLLLEWAGELDAHTCSRLLTDYVVQQLQLIEGDYLRGDGATVSRPVIGTSNNRLLPLNATQAKKVAQIGYDRARPAVLQAQDEARLAKRQQEHALVVANTETAAVWAYAQLGAGPGNEAKANDARSAFLNAWRQLMEAMPDAFQYNVLTDQICVRTPDGLRPLSGEEVETMPDLVHDLGFPSIPRSTVIGKLKESASRNKYNPMAQYLEGLLLDDSIPEFDLLQLAPLTLRTDPTDTLTNRMVAAAILSAAARTLFPGCPQRGMLLLLGGQNCGKTQWIRNLTPDRDWVIPVPPESLHGHGDTSKSLAEKARRGVFALVDEVDGVLLSRDAAVLKNLVSGETDVFRPAHAAGMATRFDRHFVFIGASNEQELLRDPTGNTRYWQVVVDEGEEVSPGVFNKGADLNALRQVRDAMWKAAAQMVLVAVEQHGTARSAAEAGAWGLDRAEMKELAARQRVHAQGTAFDDRLQDYLDKKRRELGEGACVALAVAFGDVFDMAPSQVQRERKGLEQAMANCGWEKAPKGTKKRVLLAGETKEQHLRVFVRQGETANLAKAVRPTQQAPGSGGRWS